MSVVKKIAFWLIIPIIATSCNWYTNTASIKLDPRQFKDSLLNENVQVIDVRTPKEYAQGHIKNAININYNSKNFKDSLTILNTQKPVYIYCRSGKRSANSVTYFKEVGFSEVYELEGGILNWLSNKLEVIE